MAAFIVPEEELVENRKVEALKVDPDSVWIRCIFGENRLAFRKIDSWRSESYDEFLALIEATKAMEERLALEQEAAQNEEEEGDVSKLILTFKSVVDEVEDIKKFLCGISSKSQAEFIQNEQLSTAEAAGLFSVVLTNPATQTELEEIEKK